MLRFADLELIRRRTCAPRRRADRPDPARVRPPARAAGAAPPGAPQTSLLERVWGYDLAGDDNIVEVYVRYLRDRLGDRGARPLLRTVRGVGYTLRDD